MANIKNPILTNLITDLANEGNKIIIHAYERSDYSKNKTQNLHDSYGSAVYFNGVLQERTIRYMTERAASGRYNMYTGQVETGRNEIDKFLRDYKASPSGLELVVAAAMFYARPLEDGTYADNGKKWKVISLAHDDLERLQREIKGSEIHTIRNGRRDG